MIQQSILSDVGKIGKFPVLADSSTDASKVDQLSIVLGYVKLIFGATTMPKMYVKK